MIAASAQISNKTPQAQQSAAARMDDKFLLCEEWVRLATELEPTMHITPEQAVEMYARFLKARYGAAARKFTEEKISQLRSTGDMEGVRVWGEVARRV
jgi:hypothetical protein